MNKLAHSDSARQPNVRVSLTLPLALVDVLDAEAARIGVPRSALMEYWVSLQLAGPVFANSRSLTWPAPEELGCK